MTFEQYGDQPLPPLPHDIRIEADGRPCGLTMTVTVFHVGGDCMTVVEQACDADADRFEEIRLRWAGVQ